jgi:hypothetical protein
VFGCRRQPSRSGGGLERGLERGDLGGCGLYLRVEILQQILEAALGQLVPGRHVFLGKRVGHGPCDPGLPIGDEELQHGRTADRLQLDVLAGESLWIALDTDRVESVGNAARRGHDPERRIRDRP